MNRRIDFVYCIHHVNRSFLSRRTSTTAPRRSMPRRSTVRRTAPVEKLLFLRHRAKENMKQGLN